MEFENAGCAVSAVSKLMIVLTSPPYLHHHPHHCHPPHLSLSPSARCGSGVAVELAGTEVAARGCSSRSSDYNCSSTISITSSSSNTMPEAGGDIDVLAPARIHLASRRRFDLKLDLASALSGRERGFQVNHGVTGAEKKPRLELLTTPASIISSKLSETVSCSSCMGGRHPSDDSPVTPPEDFEPSRSITRTAVACLGQATSCTFRAIRESDDHDDDDKEERSSKPWDCEDNDNVPPSPCRSGNILTASNNASFRCIPSSELAAKLKRSRPGVLVIDCRPFLCYNAGHVQGAVNISCTDRFNRKRLQQGKVGVLDLLAATHGNRDNLKRRHARDVVLYDDRSSGQQRLDSDSALHIVLTTLHREGKQPSVLQGGMKQFEAEYPDLCWSSRRQLEIPGRLLCSPTNDTVEPEIETATVSQVLPFLYLGNERDAAELERLRRHNITYVLNVTAHVPQYWHAHGIRYKRIPASDSAQQNLKQYFEEAIEYIDDARQNGANVLIHCHAGVSRSATITIAYILKHTKLVMSDAYKYVKGKRSIISPNFNFLGQLLEFEQDLNSGHSLRILNPRLVELESTV